MTIYIAVVLSLLTLGFIAYPFFRRGDGAAPGAPPPRGWTGADPSAEIEAPLPSTRQAPARFCSNCGAKIKAGDRFCHQCGQRLDGRGGPA